MEHAGEISTHDPTRTQPGYILYSPYAGEGFVLIDREGRVVHRWPTGRYTKVAELLPGGRLLYAQMREGVFEADWDGRTLWSHACRQHHDFRRKPDGATLILCNEFTFNARLFHGAIDKSDVLIEVDRAGNIVWQYHFYDGLDDLAELGGISFSSRKNEDWAHANTVESLIDTELGRRDRRFREGNVLFSCRNLHTIGVIDHETRRIVWAFGHGRLDGQHMPTLLPNGRMLLFDNGTSRGFSRVIEIEPLSGKMTWEFRVADYAFARARSGQELLPNGNLLICCGNPGSIPHAADPANPFGCPGILMEVTREGEIVWEFRNRVPGLRENYRHAVYRAAFCPAENVEPFL